MYKLLKNYKNLENYNLNSQITQIERLEERSILVKFYPDPIISDENSILNFLNLDQKKVLSLKNLGIPAPINPLQDFRGAEYNYCPLNQQYFILKNFLEEEFIALPSIKERETFIKENLPQQEFIIYILDRFLKLRLKNSTIKFDVNIEKVLWNKLILKYHFKIYKKFFGRLEKPYQLNFLLNISKIFLNRNLRRFRYSLNCAKSQIRLFVKKYIKACVFLFLNRLCKNCLKNKKARYIYLMLSRINHGGLVFNIPCIKEHIFIPYGFLKTRGKFPLDWVKYCLQRKITLFFKMTIHSSIIKRRSKKFMNLIGRPYETTKNIVVRKLKIKTPKQKNIKKLKKKRYNKKVKTA